LDDSKNNAIDKNKDLILNLLNEEIIKRYVYREGLYDYYKTHDPGIKKADEILSNPTTYMDYLR